MSASRLFFAIWATVPACALAQAPVPGDPEVARVRTELEYGQFKDVIRHVQERIDRGGLSEPDLVELHKLAGLAAFNLERKDDATRHFGSLLRLDPDHELDPFLVPPPAVTFLNDLRRSMATELDPIRVDRRLRQDRLRRDQEEKERARKEEEERRRRADDLPRAPPDRVVESRSYLVNFVPFGAGQFQQDRTRPGIVLATTEGVLAATSLIAYIAYGSFIHLESRVVGTNRAGDPVSVTFRGIDRKDQRQAEVWGFVKYASAIGFFGAHAYGMVDAILHHDDRASGGAATPAPAAPGPTPPPPAKATLPGPPPRTQLFVAPTPTGLCAGFGTHF